MEDEYHLLALVLREHYWPSVQGGFVCSPHFHFGSGIKESQTQEAFDLFFHLYLSSLELETLRDVARKSQENVGVESLFEGLPCEVLSRPSLSKRERIKARKLRSNEDPWPKFYRDHPGASGILQLSRVGFNEARDQALLSVGLQVGGLIGEGHYFFLKRAPEWSVADRLLAWIS